MEDVLFRSTIVESINALREDVAALHLELRQIKRWVHLHVLL